MGNNARIKDIRIMKKRLDSPCPDVSQSNTKHEAIAKITFKQKWALNKRVCLVPQSNILFVERKKTCGQKLLLCYYFDPSMNTGCPSFALVLIH